MLGAVSPFHSVEVFPSSAPWANGGDAECLGVSLPAREKPKILGRTKAVGTAQGWRSFRQLLRTGAVSWLLGAVKGHLMSTRGDEEQQEQDDVQNSL